MLTLVLAILLVILTAEAAHAGRSIEQQIRRAFPDDPAGAVCIARRESGLRPSAYFAGNYGLFQINLSSHRYLSAARLFTVSYNIAAARRIYLDSRRRFGNGWLPWSTRGMCGR